MTQDNLPDDLSPSLGGDAAQRTTSYEPSFSLDRLLPGLREAPGSDDRGQRLDTIEQTIEGGSERIVPMLIEMLQDVDNAKSRQRIVAMLRQLGDAWTVGALVNLLDDVDAGFRKVVVWVPISARLVISHGGLDEDDAYSRRPLVVNNYTIYAIDIKPKGFRAIEFDGFIADETVAQVKNLLEEPKLVEEMAETNYRLGQRYFSYRVLERRLATLIGDCFGEQGAFEV